jgi:acyl phosphate:glycerol-3-phosphate acyltransferase
LEEYDKMDMMTTAAALVGGYFLGSIPFGVILTRLFGAGDLRQIGSGNIGATNVLRTGRKGLAAGTLLLDAAKGAAAVCLARMVDPSLAIVAGAGAFFGHLYPVWLGFKGGKGVATLLGISLALAWLLGLIFAAVWLGAMAITRISSVGGMAAALSGPITAYVLLDQRSALVLAGLAAILIWKHKDNIDRLRAGTEPRIGSSNG